ncbi:valine--tRNA ligase [Candidatus Uhrbacteria bacterium CG10_big_fil_rev_8_21_14_0_10_48_16]|uniref:Valine--tRNA ligase n=1 Tax=Candidatus Uhrbacteria bacterium CG10_big_fil_rev_8_21_14_0_10_48_16 TaxID=1975038 RepID=A0A2M8LHG6_9BACT|nr:MAG: valine--tRNA ligase [Candidatus Uhrbacteria bacterium CG10_big_fil_rev_8_21_14_0_10_48_16]
MAKQDIPKAYEAKEYEDAIYTAWEKSGFFNPDNLPGERTESFSIVLPPPNVTGTLHMGHAVMLAIEDIMTRFNRMRWRKALWVPGTDHAAIATQTKVEKLLMAQGMKDPRQELGREEFLKRVEAFASESHDTIVNQAKKMGASLDWSREAYTLDEARNRAVNTVFKMMYDDGLIYRGDRLVNWCPRCKSTLADDEVEYREHKSKFYYFKYGPVVIGTARPETKFLDKIIIVHPQDDRYKDLVGKEFEVEWIEGPVMAKMVADEAADREMGSGAMTITPAHSFVDFDLAKKYGFDVVQIIGEDGKFTAAAGSFAGKNAHEAREEIVEKLTTKGLVDHIDEEYVHNLSVCYRCGEAVEPLPKRQWFIDVNKAFAFKGAELANMKKGDMVTLKQLMQTVVREGQIEIIPDRFNKTYFHWIDNLRDWNISRQIWFGHRVPVWYRGEEITVGTLPEGDGWEQDPDTLDTWFSSGLWTFSTLGWPDQIDDLKTFHPTTVLETGYDILFFWVARMILMTTYTLGQIPFEKVYLHGLVRDEQGRKMSKSLGNIIDPLDMIAEYGADATRLSLTIGSTPGNDSKLSEAKVAGYRNFTNKLWNISRFVFMQVEEIHHVAESEIVPKTLADHWILSHFCRLQVDVTNHLEAYEFSQAGEKLRDFTWGKFADWYLEVAKVQKDESTDSILLFILERLLAYWHPFMPFVTEELWKQIDPETMLIVHEWPVVSQSFYHSESERWFEKVQGVIVAIRNIRSEYGLTLKQKVDVVLVGAIPDDLSKLVELFAGVRKLTKANKKPVGEFASVIVRDIEVLVSLEGIIDQEAERAKLSVQYEETVAYIKRLEGKLANEAFTSKAPEQVVADMRQNLEEAQKKAQTLTQQLTSG